MITNCQLLLQSINDAVLMLDKDGLITYSNPATLAVTGYEPGDLQHKHLAIFYEGREDVIKAEYEISLALKNGRFTSEGWKVRKDDSSFWAELVIDPLREGSSVIGFCCLIRDVSHRKEQELTYRRSEEKYRLMVEGVKDYAIFMLDPGGHILTWNEGARAIKGYLPNEIIGKHFSTFYTAEDLDDKKPERELVIATATGKYEEEGWRVRKNGSVFWANIVITALFNSENKLIGFSKVTRDLSERKESQELLRQSEERYRSLVEQVVDYGIFLLDDKGRIVSWNEGAKRIKGYTAAEVNGKYFSIFYSDEDIRNGKPGYELKVAQAEGKFEEEGWRLRKDGTRFWANVVITPLYNSQNILIGFSKVTRDLTERKASERALKESHDRYRQLASELKVINTELSYANGELEQFTSIVSHDLQEPVRTIKSFLQLIDMKLEAGQYADLKTYITKAINAASRMRELIQNLLQYSQLDKGQRVEKEVDVSQLISETLQNLKVAIEASRAKIVVDSQVERVTGDPIQLVQLIQNLLGNALKFTDSDEPQITITCREEKGHVKFAVTDNGIGIAESDLTKVFEIFRRLNTSKDYPGTGIGLAICKKIVDRHNGRIWPESTPGKGTTFYFTLNDQPKEIAFP